MADPEDKFRFDWVAVALVALVIVGMLVLTFELWIPHNFR